MTCSTKMQSLIQLFLGTAKLEVKMLELRGFIFNNVAEREQRREEHISSIQLPKASLLQSACMGNLACKPVLTPEIGAFLFYDAYSKVKNKYFQNCVSVTNV